MGKGFQEINTQERLHPGELIFLVVIATVENLSFSIHELKKAAEEKEMKLPTRLIASGVKSLIRIGVLKKCATGKYRLVKRLSEKEILEALVMSGVLVKAS